MKRSSCFSHLCVFFFLDQGDFYILIAGLSLALCQSVPLNLVPFNTFVTDLN